MDHSFWLSPPAAIVLIFAFSVVMAFLFRRLAFKPKQRASTESYGCGEPNVEHHIQPDYSQFFPFAFFFTLLHVAALVLATAPTEKPGVLAIALIYAAGAVAGLFILRRK
jgi:NADH-quinone oxidoreductase subunit A